MKRSNKIKARLAKKCSSEQISAKIVSLLLLLKLFLSIFILEDFLSVDCVSDYFFCNTLGFLP
uniref:Uncharacterized protein n=1 Tax=Rhizophagus irregularis (strain DAOM 181602 / DAOM 197198 / MUCL 43194) TaxID=747089 RepID=U9UMM3_RHIID